MPGMLWAPRVLRIWRVSRVQAHGNDRVCRVREENGRALVAISRGEKILFDGLPGEREL